MSLEKNKDIIRKMVEASNKRNLAMINEVIDEFMALDFIDHTSQVRGRENAKQGYAMVLKDYPDFHRTIEDIIAEGDKVWFLERVTGTASSGKKDGCNSPYHPPNSQRQGCRRLGWIYTKNLHDEQILVVSLMWVSKSKSPIHEHGININWICI